MLILWFIVAALWAAGFLLLPRLRPCARAGGPESAPDLSLVVPARNEEHNLPALLNSLAGQSVRPREIIVVDDGSADRTAALAAELGATVLAGQPLPEGWRGKTWACHQGARAASGDLLCFVDADTWFEPGGLARVLACYEGGAFSVGPWHAIRRPYENLSLFFNLNMVAGTVPDRLFGQMLLVDRTSYLRVGGHEAVRGHILENFRLAQQFSAAGVRVRSVAGRGVVSFRMYPGGAGEMVAGWIKGFASGAGRTPWATLCLLVAWMSALAAVPPGLLLGGDPLAFGSLYLLAAAQVAWFGRRVGSFRWYAALLYPLPLGFFFVVFFWSSLRAGNKVTWKGRTIHAD
jgi:4,4'-diaponeurosporenoate glycosyltransferase